MPGHYIEIHNGKIEIGRYWDINYDIDFNHSKKYFTEKLEEKLLDSMELHCRSDVPLGAYVSGGVDSSLLYSLSSNYSSSNRKGFHGRYLEYDGYDESKYADLITSKVGGEIHYIDIKASDFIKHINDVIYLDYPVAGPGSFSVCPSRLKIKL